MFADAIGSALDSNYGTVTLIRKVILHDDISNRVQVVGALVDRLKEVNAQNPVRLVKELMDSYLKPNWISKLGQHEDGRLDVERSNDYIITALKDTIPKLSGYLRDEVEREANRMNANNKGWAR